MKSIFIASSRKFYRDVERLVQLCKEHGIKAETAGKPDSGEDTLESEKAALLRAFQRINDSDIMFVMSNGGYIGKTVAMELAYAYGKNKEIVSSEEIKELSARALVTRVLAPEELVKKLKS